MAQATYHGEDWSVTFVADAHKCDYGVRGSPVWHEYDNPVIHNFEFMGFPWPLDMIPRNVYDVLLEYADECEEWDHA